MRIAVLTSPESWYFKDLNRAACSQHQLFPVCFSRLSATLVAPATCRVTCDEFDLGQTDAVLVRTMPPGSLEQVVFRMDLLGRLAEQTGVRVLNSPRAVEAAVDKFLASAKLHAAGLLTPATIVCQSVEDAMIAFEKLGGDVVVKPLFGSEGRGMTRVTDEDIALRVFKSLVQLNAVVYLQSFIAHEGHDLRCLVLGNRIWCMRRRHPTDWRTNISRGATAEPFEIDEQLAATTRAAAQCLGAEFAGVDILTGRDGRQYVLEVNAVPGWKALSRTLHVDIAAHLIDFLARRL
jgi:ribosomal protein S6--L-glutamate ligase